MLPERDLTNCGVLILTHHHNSNLPLTLDQEAVQALLHKLLEGREAGVAQQAEQVLVQDHLLAHARRRVVELRAGSGEKGGGGGSAGWRRLAKVNTVQQQPAQRC